MTQKQGKVWGETKPLFHKNNVEMHLVTGRHGGHSSRHRHAHKFNFFYVISGELRVEIEQPYDLKDITFLHKGESCVVPPGRWHLFEVIEDTLALEIYWVELSTSDIERDGHGGMNGEQGPEVSEGPGEVHKGPGGVA